MKKNSNIIFYIVVLILILIIYTIYQNKLSITKVVVTTTTPKTEKTEDDIKKECSIKTNKYDLNSSKCLQTKVDKCELGSYKQCTNNIKPKLKTCDCNNRSSLLCNDDENLSEKCLMENKMYDTNNQYNNNESNTRVGMFNSDYQTVFDKLK